MPRKAKPKPDLFGFNGQALTRAQRDRIAGGKMLLNQVDGRNPLVRRYRDIMDAILNDQGAGDRTLGEARLQLIKRYAAVAMISEVLETNFVSNKPFDVVEYAQLVSVMVRLGSRIGLERHARIVLTLDEFLAQRARAQGKPVTPQVIENAPPAKVTENDPVVVDDEADDDD